MSDTDKNTTGSLSVTQQKILEQHNLRERVKQRQRERAAALPHHGRPKGAKNKLTLLREAVKAKAENMVLDDWEEVVETTLEMAKGGDTTCLKILWDRVIPSKRAIDESGNSSDKMNVTINIGGLEVKSVMGERQPDPVEGEFVDITVGETENGNT